MSFITTCTASASSQNSQSDLIDIRKQCVCPQEDQIQIYSSFAERTRAIKQISSERCCPTWTLLGITGTLDVSGISGELFQLVGGIPATSPALFQLLTDTRTLMLLADTNPIYKIRPTEPYQIVSLLTQGPTAATIPDLSWMPNPPPS